MPENTRIADKLFLVPFVNYILNFLQVTPDVDEIKDILNTIGLVAALLLSCDLSLFGSMDKATLQATDAYFAGENCMDDECFHAAAFWKANSYGHRVSYMLGIMLFSSCFFSVISLVIVLVVIIGLASRPDAPEGTDKVYHVAWWKSVRFCVIAAFSALIAAIVFTLTGAYHLMLVKYPDYSYTGNDPSLWDSAAIYNWMVILVSCLGLISVGVGQILAERAANTAKVAPEAEAKETSKVVPFKDEDFSNLQEENVKNPATLTK